MGDFAVSCGITNMTISEKDKCVLFPLVPQGLFKNKITNQVELPIDSSFCSNENVFMFYNLFSLPIIGLYNGYGQLEEIEKDYNTKIIEDFFGISIEEFTLAITRNQYDDLKIKKNKLKFLKTISGMFGLYDAYKFISKLQKETFFTHGKIDDFNLRLLGFNQEKQIKEKDFHQDTINNNYDCNRYKYIYTNKNFPYLCVSSDGKWSSIAVIIDGKYKIVNQHLYTVKAFISAWNKEIKKRIEPNQFSVKLMPCVKTTDEPNIFPVNDTNIKLLEIDVNLKNTSIEEIDYLRNSERFNNVKGLYKTLMNAAKKKSLKDSDMGSFYGIVDYSLSTSSSEFNPITKLYLDSFDNQDFKDKLITQKKFNNSFWVMNKFYMPTVHHGQYGEPELQKKMIEFISEYLDKKIKEGE